MKRNDLRAFIALALIPLLLLPQGVALAGFAIPGFTRPGGPALAPPLPGALPIESGILPEGVALDRSRPNHLEVNQSRDKVVIRWESFDIGSDASTHFNQQGNADSVALNRIADTGVPSQIFGRLTADGKLYLVNKNGILFGEGSQVNLHSLVATSLDPVDEQALLNGQSIQLQGTGTEGSILNEGTIQTKQGGQVVMVAPQVA
ncbi:MAG: filamentous hemagglutinin N-terminal domain-containing protein, partial [Desulfovibrionaceae bacterium]|nr:filamentous hemagglutinin N-terminal domain-containing protein [Desulfovibrionaceae bacterium]